MNAPLQSVPRPWPHWSILNVWIDDLPMGELLDRLDLFGGTVFTFNPDHAYHLHHSQDFLQAYRSADIITMDSHYLLGAMRLRGLGLQHKLSGSDIVPAFLRRHAGDPSTRVFLLGAKPGVAGLAAQRINAAAGRELVVGAHGPSMDFVNDGAEIEDVIALINASGANVLLVGLGAPKQETWIASYRHQLPGVKVLMGVGATIDYEAGVVQRAPRWLRLLSLEWAYRVATEPRRYLLRYLRNIRVFWWVVKEHRGTYRPAFHEKAEQQ